MSPLSEIFKAYDIRGTVPDQLDATKTRAIGAAFARFVGTPRVLVAHDMRSSGVELVAAFSDGVRRQGTDVVLLGLASTDLLYYASGSLDAPGAMFTASHNPAQYNGIKLCFAGARPIGVESGLADIQNLAETYLAAGDVPTAGRLGEETSRDLLDAFASHVVSFIDPAQLRPLRVIADTANGMGGLVVPAVLERLPGIELEVMYGKLDGTFPNHPADPLQPANQRDLQRRVVSKGADVGLAFDGDADRVFLVDELGRGMSGSTTTAMLAVGMLRKHPGSKILHNLICSKAVPEVIREHGGVPIRTRVGHSFIKQVMAETGAVFGGEHSAHYYFRDNYRADSGIIATVFVLEHMGITGQALSVLRKPLERYADSGEINTEVDDPQATIAKVAAAYPKEEQDHLDGLTVDRGSWWFNLRPSNTEPLLRLNLEAANRDACDEHVAEVLAIVTSD
jgi:phosphomannomutase